MNSSSSFFKKEHSDQVTKEIKTIAKSSAKTQLEYIIYHAKLQHTFILQSLIDAGVCIDVSFCLNTPIKSLAKEGHEEAVLYLMEKFDANVNEAIEGAAEIGSQKFAELLINEYSASLHRACYGASKNGKNDSWVEELLERGAREPFAWAGKGAGGHDHKFEDDFDSNKWHYCEGAARSNIYQEQNLLDNNLSFYILRGAVNGGHINLCKLAIKSVPKKKLYNIIIEAGNSGHSDIITFLKEFVPQEYSDLLSVGHASAGHYQLTMSLKNEKNIFLLIQRCVMNNHFKLANALVDSLSKEAKFSKENLNFKEKQFGASVEANLRGLSLIQDDNLRKYIAEEMKHLSLLDEATGLSNLIFSKKLSFYQARALTKYHELAEVAIFFISKTSIPIVIINLMLSYIKIAFPENNLVALIEEKISLEKKKDLLPISINCSSTFYQKYKHAYTIEYLSRVIDSESLMQPKTG